MPSQYILRTLQNTRVTTAWLEQICIIWNLKILNIQFPTSSVNKYAAEFGLVGSDKTNQ